MKYFLTLSSANFVSERFFKEFESFFIASLFTLKKHKVYDEKRSNFDFFRGTNF